MKTNDNKGQDGDFTTNHLVFDAQGNLVLPTIDEVVASAVKHGPFGIKIQHDQILVTRESNDAVTAVLGELKKLAEQQAKQLKDADGELKQLRTDLRIARLTSTGEPEYILHPLVDQSDDNPEGVSTPDLAFDKAILIKFSDGRTWILRCQLPKLGETLAFGGLQRTGFYCRLSCINRPSTRLGRPAEVGYMLILEGDSGESHREDFIPAADFEGPLTDHTQAPYQAFAEHSETPFGLIMRAYDQYAKANAIISDDRRENEYIDAGWTPPPGHRKYKRWERVWAARQPRPAGPTLAAPSTAASHQLSAPPPAPAAAKPGAGGPPSNRPPPVSQQPDGGPNASSDKEAGPKSEITDKSAETKKDPPDEVVAAEDRTAELETHMEPADDDTAEALRALAEEDRQRREAAGATLS